MKTSLDHHNMVQENGAANGAIATDNPAFTIEEGHDVHPVGNWQTNGEINANEVATKKPQRSEAENGVHHTNLNAGEADDKKIKFSDIEDGVRCGYCGWKPDWLQVFNNPKMFLFLLCWFSFVQGKAES